MKKTLRLILFLVIQFLSSICIIQTTQCQTTHFSRSYHFAVLQGLHFGTFTVQCPGNCNTLKVEWDGKRSCSGGIILLPAAPVAHPAEFEIWLPFGRNVVITYSQNAILTGKNGETLQLDLGPTDKGEHPVLSSPGNDLTVTIPLKMGGTLHIPANASPGVYTGEFEVSLHQE
jgi:hypothetical protein